MDAHPTSAVDTGPKILLVRSGPAGSTGCSFVLSGQGVYTRVLAGQAEVDQALEAESFELVLDDARSHVDNPFVFVEKFRRRNSAAPFLLLCPTLELDGVVKAIRFGVSDILSPPFDFKALHERAVDLMRMRLNGAAANITPARWAEIARFLTELGSPDEEAAAGAPHPAARMEPAEPPSDRGERDRLLMELDVERKARAAAEAARGRAAAENQALASEVQSARVSLQAAERKLAEAELAATEAARREKAVSTELELARAAAAPSTEQQAQREAERAAQARRELAEERQVLELSVRNQRSALEEREAALTRREAEAMARSTRDPAECAPPRIAPALTGLSKRATELAAMIEKMTDAIAREAARVPKPVQLVEPEAAAENETSHG